MLPKDQVLEVWGELACFTRPEMKVERFSYPIITPSAARGIFDAIYCKPHRDGTNAEFRWQVTRIEVLSPPSYIALRRNEIKEKGPSDSLVARWRSGKSDLEPIFADEDGQATGRTQRQTMALKNVRYRLHAQVRPWRGFEDRTQGIEAQFRRRAAEGKCFYQPYFGCREFPAYFDLVEPGASLSPPVNWTADLGLVLYDVFDLSRPGRSADQPSVSLFHCCVNQGILEVPEYSSEAVLRVGGAPPC
jgi:CRISPR-associated protein Cas5d